MNRITPVTDEHAPDSPPVDEVERELRLHYTARTKKKTATPQVKSGTGTDMPNPGFPARVAYP